MIVNFEPQKLFIGLTDFFSVLLPGALLTYLLMDEVGPAALGARYAALAGAEATAAFLFASYLFGHLVFLLGAWLDEVYDWARGHTLNAQIAALAHRDRLLPAFARMLVWLVFKSERNLAVNRAGQIKRKLLDPLSAADAVNTFQWCKVRLSAESPAALAMVQRFEADSKFFRCLAVVLVLALAAWPFQQRWHPAGAAIVAVLLLLSFWRYLEQRFKATNQAYWAVIALTAQAGKVALAPPAPPAGNPAHVRAVVYRVRVWGVRYLLVETEPGVWELPVGAVEEAEHPRETAVRTVHAQTGDWARMVHDPGAAHDAVEATGAVRTYAMQSVGHGLRTDRRARHLWLSLDAAVARASHLDTRELLRAAEQRRTRPETCG